MTTGSTMEQAGHQHQEQTNGSNNVRHPREPKMNVSFPPPAPSSGWNRRQNSLRAKDMVDGGREPKKSLSMGQIQPTAPVPVPATAVPAASAAPPVPVSDKIVKENQDINGNTDSVGEGGQKSSNNAESTKRREHKSEYKNRFRPFSQYEYIGDGKFHNTSTSPPNEIDNQAGGKFAHKPRHQLQDSNLAGEPWYQEVIELRKQANDYKQRGWGTDLVPPHMSQIYNQQMNLHEQAARRESLSALALAIATPRSLNKDEKEKENLRKSSSPNKPRSSRPRTAPPKTLKKASVSRSESSHPSPTPGTAKETSKDTLKETKEHTKDTKQSTGRSVSAGSPASRGTKSARDTPDQGREVEGPPRHQGGCRGTGQSSLSQAAETN